MITKPMKIDTKELSIVKTQVEKSIAVARELSIKSLDDMVIGTNLLVKIKTVGKLIDEKKKAITQPLNEALKEIRTLFAPLEANYAEAERIVKAEMIRYNSVVEAEAAEKAKKLEARVDKGTMKFETAIDKIAEIPQTAKTATEKGQVTFREQVTFEITDEQKIPRQYLVPDLVSIRKAILANVEIEGVKKVVTKVPVTVY